VAAEHPNVVVVKRLYEALAATDLETILAILHEDIVFEQTDELPWGGTFTGHEGMGQFFGALTGTITSKVTHTAVFAAGDQVVQVGRTAGTVNSNGAAFNVDEVHIHTVRDGRVVRWEARIDTPAMLEALGAG
jgi:hypothetical protein